MLTDFIRSLEVMGLGMLGLFVVCLAIILATSLLIRFSSGKKEQ